MVAEEPEWWRFKLSQGPAAVISEAGRWKVQFWNASAPPPDSGNAAANAILESKGPENPITAAMQEGARRFLAAQSGPDRALIIGSQGTSRAIVDRLGFDSIILPPGSPQLSAAIAGARLIVCEEEPDNFVLDLSMSNNVPLYSMPLLSDQRGDNALPILRVQIESSKLRKGPIPTWAAHEDALGAFLSSADAWPIPRALTSVYERNPHFRVWAYYAGRRENADITQAVALMVNFFAMHGARLRADFPVETMQTALRFVRSPGKESWKKLAVRTISGLLTFAAARDRLVVEHRRLRPLDEGWFVEKNNGLDPVIAQQARALMVIFNLAQDYNRLLAAEKAGSHRTAVVSQIVARMRERAHAASVENYRELLTAIDSGHRLWAYIGLGEVGGPAEIEALLEAALREGEPSAQLQSIQACKKLSTGLKILPESTRSRLKKLAELLPKGSQRLAATNAMLGVVRFGVQKRTAAKKKQLRTKLLPKRRK